MFKDNKYTKHYMSLVEKARTRKLAKDQYKERHHIIPQSLGGTNDKDNLVWLTGREHALCHWALLKMTEGEDRAKMSYAFNGMNAENEFQQRYRSRIITRAYERHRIEHAKLHSERMKGKPAWNKGRKLEGDELMQQRERTRNRIVDPIRQAEGQAKRIAKVTGQKRTEETRKKMSMAHTGIVKGPQTEEHRKAISDSIKGKPKKPGHADNVRNAVLGNVSINKDGVEKKVKRDVLDQFLAEGWSLGGRKRK
jgi:hypothetical protein